MYSPDHKPKGRSKGVVVRYGALANKYFPLFNEDMAAAITGNGRYFIRMLANYIEDTLQGMHKSADQYVIYGDTDSVYFQIAPFMEMYKAKNPGLPINDYVEWADQFEQKVIQPVIQKVIEDFARELNAFDKDALGVEREIIADCLSGKTRIKIKQDGKTSIKKLSKIAAEAGLANGFGSNEVVDVSGNDIKVLSYNEETGENELKRILNVQKKTTTKRMVELVSPSGRVIELTEDHQVAVMEDDNVIYKPAGDITEEDDVVHWDCSATSRVNSDLYEVPYINHGSERSDPQERGKRISMAKRKSADRRRKEEMAVTFNRINSLLKRNSGKHKKILFRLMDVVRNSSNHKTVPDLLGRIKENISYLYIDEDLVSLAERIHKNRAQYRDQKIRDIKETEKYGPRYKRMLAVREGRNPGFGLFEKRVEVIQRKATRSRGKTPEQTAKKRYRKEVNRYTKRSIRGNDIPNIDLRDKYHYNLDHIVPVMYGYERGIPPELIGHHSNLRVIKKIDNIKKRCNIDHDCVNMELFKDYLGDPK